MRTRIIKASALAAAIGVGIGIGAGLNAVIDYKVRFATTPVLEFGPTPPVATPPVIRPGQPVTITYPELRRNFPCRTELTIRFQKYDPVARKWVAVPKFDRPKPGEKKFYTSRANVTADFREFSFELQTPASMAPGRWRYAPELQPVEDCKDQPMIYPPPVEFKVSGGTP